MEIRRQFDMGAFVGKTRKGFSLVELAVVVIIVGVLAAFGVPRMLKSVERSKSAEAFKYVVRRLEVIAEGAAKAGVEVLDGLNMPATTKSVSTPVNYIRQNL